MQERERELAQQPKLGKVLRSRAAQSFVVTCLWTRRACAAVVRNGRYTLMTLTVRGAVAGARCTPPVNPAGLPVPPEAVRYWCSASRCS